MLSFGPAAPSLLLLSLPLSEGIFGFQRVQKNHEKLPPVCPAIVSTPEPNSEILRLLPLLPAIILGLFCLWGMINVLTYVIPQIAANLRGGQDLKVKYCAGVAQPWAVVTGASSGIGRAISEALARQGISVVLVAKDDPVLEKCYGEVCAAHPSVEFRKVGVDLAAPDDSYMGPIVSATDGLDVRLLFNNAGFIVTGFFHDAPIGKHIANLQARLDWNSTTRSI